MCKSPQAGQLQFQRAMFNLFACNQDDHSKNWAFLQNDQGQWQPAPFYDITFNPHPFDEHTTAFLGHGKQPPLKVIQTLAENAGYASWQLAREDIREIADAVMEFSTLAKQLAVKKSTYHIIEQQLQQKRQANAALLQ